MIERWLQISCDNPMCGETENSTAPNMTVVEFRADLASCWRKVGGKDACCAECAAEIRAMTTTSPPPASPSSKPTR